MRIYDASVRLPLKLGGKSEGLQPIRDLDTVRGFLSGVGPIALFDLPWLPIYLGICFLFHTYIGLTALGGAMVLVVLTLFTEILTRRPTRNATQFAMARNTLMEASRRNRPVGRPSATHRLGARPLSRPVSSRARRTEFQS